MKYVVQIDKYTLAPTKALYSEPVKFSVDNITEENLNRLNELLDQGVPTFRNLEFFLMLTQHDLNNLQYLK